MRKLLKIYLGVPIKFYIGNENYEKFENFYNYHQVSDITKAIKDEYTKVQESAEKIY